MPEISAESEDKSRNTLLLRYYFLYILPIDIGVKVERNRDGKKIILRNYHHLNSCGPLLEPGKGTTEALFDAVRQEILAPENDGE